jgi:hypothetical protein
MDELQRLLGGSAVGLENGWHEDEAVGVALAELLLSVQQVVAQPLMLGCVPGVGDCLAYPWLVAVATRMGDRDIKHHVGAHAWEVTDDGIWHVPLVLLQSVVTPQCQFWGMCLSYRTYIIFNIVLAHAII